MRLITVSAGIKLEGENETVVTYAIALYAEQYQRLVNNSGKLPLPIVLDE